MLTSPGLSPAHSRQDDADSTQQMFDLQSRLTHFSMQSPDEAVTRQERLQNPGMGGAVRPTPIHIADPHASYNIPLLPDRSYSAPQPARDGAISQAAAPPRHVSPPHSQRFLPKQPRTKLANSESFDFFNQNLDAAVLTPSFQPLLPASARSGPAVFYHGSGDEVADGARHPHYHQQSPPYTAPPQHHQHGPAHPPPSFTWSPISHYRQAPKHAASHPMHSPPHSRRPHHQHVSPNSTPRQMSYPSPSQSQLNGQPTPSAHNSPNASPYSSHPSSPQLEPYRRLPRHHQQPAPQLPQQPQQPQQRQQPSPSPSPPPSQPQQQPHTAITPTPVPESSPMSAIPLSPQSAAASGSPRFFGDDKLSAFVRAFNFRDPAHVALIPQLAVDQQGSRFIQHILENVAADDFLVVFNTLLPHLISISQSPFGNYVAQKLLCQASSAQQLSFVNQLRGSLASLSCHPCGCRVIRRVLDTVDVTAQSCMTKDFAASVLDLSVHPNGTYILQRAIDKLPASEVDLLTMGIVGTPASAPSLILGLSTNKFGCLILQRLMEKSSPQMSNDLREHVVKCIVQHAQDMCLHPFSNYVVQHVLSHGSHPQGAAIISAISGSVVLLGTHKIASNVIEKCFLYGDERSRAMLTAEMLNMPKIYTAGNLQWDCSHLLASNDTASTEAGTDFSDARDTPATAGSVIIPSNLAAMTQNPFGNYVVQIMLSVMEKRDQDFVMSLLLLTPSGCRVISRFRENYGGTAASSFE